MKLASVRELNVVKQYLFDEEYDKAVNELKRLHKIYPGDKNVLFELGSIMLRQDKNVSEAIYTFALIKDKTNEHAIENEIATYYFRKGNFDKAEESYKQLLRGNEIYVCFGLHGLIKVYIHKEEFEEALKCFDRLVKVSKLIDYKITHYSNVRFYLLYKTGRIKSVRADNYYESQLVNYNEETTIEHIKRHLEEHNPDGSKIKTFHSVFNSEIDVKELYYNATDRIKDMKPCSYDFVDYYRIDINDNIGASYSSKETTCVEIVTLPNTKDILSIYPILKDHINKNIKQKEVPKKKKVYRNNYKNNKKNHK